MTDLIQMCSTCKCIKDEDGVEIPRGAPGNTREYEMFEATHIYGSAECASLGSFDAKIEDIFEEDRELINSLGLPDRCTDLETYLVSIAGSYQKWI